MKMKMWHHDIISERRTIGHDDFISGNGGLMGPPVQ